MATSTTAHVDRMPSPRFARLVDLLKELFQLDKPDLDFGFYRIMHAKSDEVTRFLERELLPQVGDAFAQYQSADRATIAAKLRDAEAQLRSLGVDPAAAPRVQELQRQLDDAVDVESLEADVYDHLYRFFRRYYSDGDFISRRVYKDDVYAIPYQGEEVKLHWANADQHYIKTDEYLKDYSFRLRPDDDADPMRVHFRLVDATEGEHDNVKAKKSKARYFILASEDFLVEEDGPDGITELDIRFVYRPATMADWPEEQRAAKRQVPKQKDLIDAAVNRVLAVTDPTFRRWNQVLGAPHIKTDGTQADYPRLKAHLNRYTARNTYDYFIHKDLRGFLRRELDFYVKNEIMRLDDIDGADAPRVEEWLSKVKVVRSIAHKIIAFLAQLEGFQKKLWLKKKFVVATSYCITVGTIPEHFYAEIAANEAQHREWVDLLGIDRIQGDLTRPGYVKPLPPSFVNAHPTLMVDTAHFADDFTVRLLEALGDLDELTDGVLFRSENFQALRLMKRRYAGNVDCVYIDPPYNAPKSEIAYKNDYKHSSFLSLLDGRLRLSHRLAASDGSHVVAIDKNEANGVARLLDDIFAGHDNVTVTVEHNRRGTQGHHFSYTNEYALFSIPMARKELNPTFRPKDEWEWKQFATGVVSLFVLMRRTAFIRSLCAIMSYWILARFGKTIINTHPVPTLRWTMV